MPKIIKKKYTHIAFVIILGTVFCLPVYIHAQSARKLERRANTSFQQKDYYNAAKLYAAILYDSPLIKKTTSLLYPFQRVAGKHTGKIRKSERNYVMYQLAESYRLYDHYKDALPQYEQYLSSQDTRFPLARLWYGNCLLANDQPEKAITAFTAFLQKYKVVDTFAQKARIGIANSNFAINNKALPPRAVVTKWQPAVSADGSNFAFEKINDSIFWFTTSRHETDKKNEKRYPVRLYSGKMNSNAVEKITGFSADGLNMGATSLSADGLSLYFTGWKEEEKSLQTPYRIFYTTRPSLDSQWRAPVEMPDPVNLKGYNTKQPFITKDGRYLLFVSDRPGGFGKYDIWMIQVSGGRAIGTAINAGNFINTDGEEASPFYDAEAGILYFSSNGKTGMGGMDIYKISGGLMPDQWTGPAINLGFPFNSVKDDLYYTKAPDSDTAYFSSDRASACCVEIFKAVPLPYTDTLKKNTNKLPVLGNKIASNKPDTSIAQQLTNNHLLDSINAITIERMHVNYHFASTRIRKADYPQLHTVIQMMEHNPLLNILIASFTDCIGAMPVNVLLSRKRSESVKAYLIKNGITTSRINIDFFGKKHFIVACKEDSSYNKEKQMANRRSDLIVTTEQNPKWIPSGNELDMAAQIQPVSAGKSTLTNSDRTDDHIMNEKAGSGYAKKIMDKNGVDELGNKQPVTQPGISGTASDSAKSIHNKIDGKNINGNIGKEESVYAKIAREKDAVRNTGNKKSNSDYAQQQKALGNNVIIDSTLIAKKKTAGINNKQPLPVRNTTIAILQPYEKMVSGLAVDSTRRTIKITELLDLTPKLKKPDIIKEMTSRTPRKSFEVYSTSDSVRIELYDNGVFDYDSVSVIYNKQLVIYKKVLQTNKPISFYVKLDADQTKNEMIFFAENLGLTPPNSALMIITDGDNKRTEVNVSSDLAHNAVIYFIKVKK